MEDAKIVELFWQRDPDAILETKRKYGDYCFAVAKNVLSVAEDCEECVNDTWLHAWNAMPPHRPIVFRMFLAKITRNLSFNRYKSLSAQKRGGGEIGAVLDELAECLADEGGVEDTMIAAELGETVRRFVNTLPERESGIFLRRYFFSEPVAKIAQRYDVTENYAMVILSRTRKKLRQCLTEEGYFDESK